MKKIFALLLVLALSLALLTSCSTVSYKDVKRVLIEDVSCESFYLYAFESADVTNCQQYGNVYPIDRGFVYSTEKLSVGDTVDVWGDCSFAYYDQYGYYNTKTGTTGTVSEIVEEYEIVLLRSSSSYTVTFFGLESGTPGAGTTAIERESLTETTKYKVEVVTDNPVFIEFHVK